MPSPGDTDYAARTVAIAALMYYSLDEGRYMTDAEYDRRAGLCAANWGALSPLRQWQLGSPEAIKTSGFQIKVTSAGVYAAASWVGARLVAAPKAWRWNKKHQVHFLLASELALWREGDEWRPLPYGRQT